MLFCAFLKKNQKKTAPDPRDNRLGPVAFVYFMNIMRTSQAVRPPTCKLLIHWNFKNHSKNWEKQSLKNEKPTLKINVYTV